MIAALTAAFLLSGWFATWSWRSQHHGVRVTNITLA